MEHTAKLNDQVAAEKRMNEQLQGKVAELQEAKSAMRSKLQSYTGSEPPSPRGEQSRPTPTPRTNLQPAMHALQADKERLEEENKQLRERLDAATRVRTTVEEQFQQSSQKAQSFAQEKYQLERQIEAKESQLSEQKQAYQSLEQEFERVRREKDHMMTSSRGEEGKQRERIELLQREKEELRSQMAHLEMEHAQKSTAKSALEREKLEHQGKIARLEEQLRQMQLESPGASVHEMTSMKTKTAPLAKRLNDALGRIRELETVSVH
jgi:DNA repair exonuclease SbcCD ATPase subunit